MIDAGATAINCLDRTEALLAGVRRAGDVTAAVGRRRYLHSGPPISLADVPGPMRGALIGALIFEGEAASVGEAETVLLKRDLELLPCAEDGGVGAMAGIVTPSMPVVVVTDRSGHIRTFSPINEGLGKALRFGAHSREVIERLHWLRRVGCPLLDVALKNTDEVCLSDLQAEGLRRGDECHNRNVATSGALLLRLVPGMLASKFPAADIAEAISRLSANPHFFLPFSMAAAKVVALSAAGFAGSPLVTAIASNGVEMGVQVSGTGTHWFRCEAPLGEPRVFDGYTIEDAQPAMGESFITEVVGLGACALRAAPAITSFIGGDQASSRRIIDEMRTITAISSSRFLIPFDDFAGTPAGFDVHRISDLGVAPTVNNGFAHRQPGIGQVGAGITRLPIAPFVEAHTQLIASQPAAGQPGRSQSNGGAP